ncbi:MAG: lactate utilization protein [Clostridiales bacterium]|nr:lactate utilization protein [Clostridiales bacterium]
MSNGSIYREKAAQTVIQGLERRGMTGEYCPTTADALEAGKRFLLPGTSVAWGGSATLDEIGLLNAIQSSGCVALDRHAPTDPEEVREVYRQTLFCDTYFLSANAVTLDGVLVNIDGNGNRVAALAFGPKQVVVIAGMNKVCPDLDSAMKRARNVAAPTNAIRFGLSTPCTSRGRCADCQNPDSICCQFLITRRSRTPGRIHVILVGEELGY